MAPQTPPLPSSSSRDLSCTWISRLRDKVQVSLTGESRFCCPPNCLRFGSFFLRCRSCQSASGKAFFLTSEMLYIFVPDPRSLSPQLVDRKHRNRMKKSIAAALLSIALVGVAQAQMQKCTAANGRITYSDAPCNNASKSSQTLDISTSVGANAPAAVRPTQAGVFESEISGKIARYLAQNDFDSATSLAVTAEHFDMIRKARRDRRPNETEGAAPFIPNQYECERTTRNAEVAAKSATKRIRDSVLDREMNIACFGPERAGQIEEARAGAPQVTIHQAAPSITRCVGAYCYDRRGRVISGPRR